jgi:hypothetical protein
MPVLALGSQWDRTEFPVGGPSPLILLRTGLLKAGLLKDMLLKARLLKDMSGEIGDKLFASQSYLERL